MRFEYEVVTVTFAKPNYVCMQYYLTNEQKKR